ncbi:rRNA methyltransferase 3A, mitochondrial [Puntigrus tetrazona]|uniref:rRNA methyltransferase 3A, mitochondrial n=1 Tax=Puntigrus tetrazona TaxID=1606681 RepID=UPI001C8A5EBB|nr:rRNA methyltransferase 3A, mitochondrial [Puntigrus tetrazona]
MAALVYNVSRGFVVFGERSLLLRGHNNHRISVSARRYVRGLRRRPVAVLYPDGERERLIRSNEAADKMNRKLFAQKDRHGEKVSERAGSRQWSGHVSEDTEESSLMRDKLAGLRFEKAPPGDDRLAKVASVARSRALQDKEGKVLLEGRRLICDALSAGVSLQTLFFSAVERLHELPLDKLQQAKLIKVRYEDMKTWSDLVAPQGVIAIFSKPDASRLEFPKEMRLQSVPLFLLCDNIRDAGTLGTVLRCAAAAGCERVLLSKGCVNAWGPKVLRAAMGAHFRLPVFSNLDWDEISEHLPEDVVVHVADDGTQAPGQTEEGFSDDSSDEESDDELSLAGLKPRVYCESWAQRSTALVIGGDSHGLSPEALRLAVETEGRRLFVPVAPGVESLNSAMAASVLLFEGRRQLLQLSDKTRRKTRSKISK